MRLILIAICKLEFCNIILQYARLQVLKLTWLRASLIILLGGTFDLINVFLFIFIIIFFFQILFLVLYKFRKNTLQRENWIMEKKWPYKLECDHINKPNYVTFERITPCDQPPFLRGRALHLGIDVHVYNSFWNHNIKNRKHFYTKFG